VVEQGWGEVGGVIFFSPGALGNGFLFIYLFYFSHLSLEKQTKKLWKGEGGLTSPSKATQKINLVTNKDM
jgi:hypothetical protein